MGPEANLRLQSQLEAPLSFFVKTFLPFLPMHICWVSLFMPSSFVPTIQDEEREKACVGFTVEQNSECSGSFIIYQTWWC